MTITAARNAAALIVRRHNLVPPVPVEKLLEIEADVIACDNRWPTSLVDAVVVRRIGQRPQVFYRLTEHPLRQRFTLAHELAHLKLAWHLGTQVCNTDQPSDDAPSQGESEQEANAFASGLLVPDRWLMTLTDEHGHDMSTLLSAIAVAEVSVQASLIALRRALPAGWVFRTNNQPYVTTRGTPQPISGIADAAQDYGRVSLHGQHVQWWRLCDPYVIPDADIDPRPSRDLLLSAIAEAIPDSGTHTWAEKSINGVVGGGTQSQAGYPAHQVYSTLRFRFANSNAHRHLLEYPDFEMWLRRMAYRIAGK
ncbi:ImmA/IrrE family metallo-endopeptidase [Nocardia sp. AG03]|uniref:ImmA/IrrE family metallo-endopeptidase n=1 Tax=Nocardia sp. AG03 TaxID=3025312 RepID=UPI0024182FE1|nr:ImmA/IrrE family metallo-endopeptidase [Nocardia sp. AG03]